MKAVILAGGFGTRLSEETQNKPKPMVEIGGKPILWHIMKIYNHFGVDEFIICLGYKGYVIKEYFLNYSLHQSDVTFDMTTGQMEIHKNNTEQWKVTLVDTGEKAMTGARIRKILPYVEDEKAFCLTYGDGVANIDIKALLKFHEENGKLATLTAVTPPGRFGSLDFSQSNEHQVREFVEKPAGDGGLINGGFFVLSPKILPYLEGGDEVIWEQAPLRALAQDGELTAFRHQGFWQPMDTLRDHTELEQLWTKGEAPWKLW